MGRVLGSLAFAGVALAAASPASAAHTIALFAGSGVQYSGVTPTVANNAMAINDGTVKVQVTAWTSSTPGTYSTSNGHIRSTLGQWDFGLGDQYNSGDEHTIDNNGSTRDFILLQFDHAVALNTVTFTSGWNSQYDSDATISKANVNYASYGGTYKTVNSSFWNAAKTQLANNKTASNTPGNSFNYGVVNTSRRQVNPTLVTSNVWLIAAKIGDLDTYKDGFKVKGFTYVDPTDFNGNAVPEPATWALLIVGFGAIGGAMRRKVRASLALA
jgi:hypothetical protein